MRRIVLLFTAIALAMLSTTVWVQAHGRDSKYWRSDTGIARYLGFGGMNGMDTVFEDDMESGVDGWSHSGGYDYWHLTTGNFHSSSHSWWHGDEGTGFYPNYQDDSLVSPPIDLTGYQYALLEFETWYVIEYYWDYGLVEISTDGGLSWNFLGWYSGSSSKGGDINKTAKGEWAPIKQPSWNHEVINLTSYVGNTVLIRFRFVSDFSITYEGWYIDDVVVKAGPPMFVQEFLITYAVLPVVAGLLATIMYLRRNE